MLAVCTVTEALGVYGKYFKGNVLYLSYVLECRNKFRMGSMVNLN